MRKRHNYGPHWEFPGGYYRTCPLEIAPLGYVLQAATENYGTRRGVCQDELGYSGYYEPL